MRRMYALGDRITFDEFCDDVIGMRVLEEDGCDGGDALLGPHGWRQGICRQDHVGLRQWLTSKQERLGRVVSLGPEASRRGAQRGAARGSQEAAARKTRTSLHES